MAEIFNIESHTLISGTDDNDYIHNSASRVTISSNAGDDFIENQGNSVTISGGDGADTITNVGLNVTINGGSGNDYIDDGYSRGNTSITSGEGSNSTYDYSKHMTISGGEGNDTIVLSSLDEHNVIEYTLGDGDDIIYNLGEKNTLRIAGGSYSTQVSGSDVIVMVGEGSITVKDAIDTSLNIEDLYATATTFPTVKPVEYVPQDYVYSGGNQLISSYTLGEKIFLGVLPTGYVFGGGNFALISSTGNLFIQNAYDKTIRFVDDKGNPFASAHKATYPTILFGGSTETAFTYLVGSDLGDDIIFAGDYGSQLWGGSGSGSDTLVGGAGADIFVCGKTQGNDIIHNASASDAVFINDATLDDVLAALGNSNSTSLEFNTGNVVRVASSEVLSAAFIFADGAAVRFNHVTNMWQEA